MLLQPRAYLHLPKQHRPRQRRPIQSRRTRHPRRVQHFKKICAVEGDKKESNTRKLRVAHLFYNSQGNTCSTPLLFGIRISSKLTITLRYWSFILSKGAYSRFAVSSSSNIFQHTCTYNF